MDTKPNHHCTESWAFIRNHILIFSQVLEEGTIYDQQLTCYVSINTNYLQ